MTYVDGIMAPVKPGRRADYLALARALAPIFLESGALRVVDAWNDDVTTGTLNDMRTAVLAVEGEDVVFSWIEWPDKATREAGWKAAMGDPRMAMPPDNPMAGERMIYGGFAVINDAVK